MNELRRFPCAMIPVPSNRIDLSADTWIEDGHVVTQNGEVAVAWLDKGLQRQWSGGWQSWDKVDDQDFDYVKPTWRIPRATARERYRYVKGEPCCYLDKQGSIRVAICSFGPASQTGLLALRALLVCGGSPKSLHILYEWTMEASHE